MAVRVRMAAARNKTGKSCTLALEVARRRREVLRTKLCDEHKHFRAVFFARAVVFSRFHEALVRSAARVSSGFPLGFLWVSRGFLGFPKVS